MSAYADVSERAKRNFLIKLNQIKMTTEERKEIIQDVIDRLLYLPEAQLKEYESYLSRLTAVYTIPMEVKNGVRIYHITKK